MSTPIVVSPLCTLPASELRWTAVRASGPGGQNVNKVASKVELRFDATASVAIDEATKVRLAALAGSRLDREGVLLVVCQDTRDQSRNLEIAREKLADLVRRALVAPKRRRPTRPSRGAKLRRLDEKKRSGEKKRARSTPRDD